jgi:hypothetical protein
MPFDFSLPSWEQVKTGVGDFLSSDVAPVALGGAAQAVMADYPTSWQYQLGGLAGKLGQSNIAAKAAQRQAAQRDAYNRMLADLLSGRSLTEAGMPGPTSANLSVSPGGEQKVSVTGDKIVSPESVGKAGQEGGQRIAPAPAVPARPLVTSTAPLSRNRMLPFLLAASAGSSGGGGGNLYGLSPEQITNISRTDILGGELSQRGISDIYSNLQKQAYTDYLDRLPAGSAVKPQLSFTDMKIDDKTRTWQYYDRVQGKRVDTGIKATEDELAGTRAPNWMQQEYVTDKGVRRSGIFKDGRLFKDLGVVPEETPETRRTMASAEDLSRWEARIEGKSEDEATPQDIENFNRFSLGQYVYIEKVTPGALWGTNKKIEKVKIPGGYTAADIYATSRKYRISIADVIASLEANKKKVQ